MEELSNSISKIDLIPELPVKGLSEIIPQHSISISEFLDFNPFDIVIFSVFRKGIFIFLRNVVRNH